MKSVRVPTLATLLTVVVTLFVGCIVTSHGAAHHEPDKSVANATQTQTANCAHVKDIICQTAGEKSPECKSAINTLELLPSKACAAASEDDQYIATRTRVIRQPCRTLVQRLCDDLGPEKDACDVVQTQTIGFTAQRCTAMLTRYSEVLDALRSMAKGNKLLTLPEQSLVAEGNRPSFGPQDAKVIVVEFSDFQCPYCRNAARTVHEIQARFERHVRFVFRQFPLNFHEHAQLAAEAALAAHAQGKFWQLHDLMFAHQMELARVDIENYAASAGLDMGVFRKNLDEHRFTSDVAEDIVIGKQVHVNGTPTMFINGKRVADASDTPAVMKIIHETLINVSSRSTNNQVMLDGSPATREGRR